MSFLAMTAGQAAALCLATAASIVALYFLKLRRRRVLVPSLLLWRRILEERQARSIFEKFRNPLSLLLALAIGLSLALALARPEIEALTGRRRRVTIVMDASPTMLARAGAETRWRRAVKKAEALIDAGGPTTEFRIADTAGFLETPYTTDHSLLRRHLSEARPRNAALRFPQMDALPDDETWFISDGVAKLDVPPGAAGITVFERAPNVGIVAFEIRSEPSAPLQYSAFLEVRNYGESPASTAIALTASDGYAIAREAVLEPGGRFQESFDLSGFAGGAVAASVRSGDDAFALDDKAFAYIPVRRKTRVLLVTTGNRYLEAALRLDAQVRLRVTDPASFAEDAAIDAYVFDRFAPASPPARPALIVGAPAASWLPAIRGAVAKPAVANLLENHPVLQHVALHDLSIQRAASIDAEGVTVIAGSKDVPLIVSSEAAGVPKWLLLTFALDASDFPFQASFPLFLENTLAWFGRESLALRRAPGLVRLPFENASIETQDG
jgi:hypothetical protein